MSWSSPVSDRVSQYFFGILLNSFVISKIYKIKKEVLEEAKKGHLLYRWTSDEVISPRILVEICKKLQSIFVDSKIISGPMNITIDWR